MDRDRTLYISNVPSRATEALIYELFLQAGPVENVTMKDGFCFVAFEDEESVLYACTLFEGVRLFDNTLRIKPRAGSKFENASIPSVPPYTNSLGRSYSFPNFTSARPRDQGFSMQQNVHQYSSPQPYASNLPNDYARMPSAGPLSNGYVYTPPNFQSAYTSQPPQRSRDRSPLLSDRYSYGQQYYEEPPAPGLHHSYSYHQNYY